MNAPLRNPASSTALALGLVFSGCLALGFSGCRSAAPPPDDASLASAIQGKIAADGAISKEPIQTSVQNGVATLNGNVSNDAVRALAARDAAQVSGIKTVVNNLSVQQAASGAAEAPPPEVTTQPDRPVHAIKESPARPEPRRIDKVQPPPAPTVQPPVQHAEQQQPAPVERVQPTQHAQQTPPPPAARDITVPSGTTLPVRITQTLDSASAQQGDNFTGVVSSDVFIDGLNVIPQGTRVSGRVEQVQDAGHFKGNSLLTIRITGIDRNGQHIAVATEPFSKAGNGRGKNTAEKVGGGAALGAILGGIFGGGKGAAIGGLAGGGLGAGAQAVTRGQQVQIPSETIIRFRTSAPVSVRTSMQSTGPAPDPTLQRRRMNQ